MQYAADHTSLSLVDLEKITGYLNIVAVVVPLGHTFLRRLYNMQLYFPTEQRTTGDEYRAKRIRTSGGGSRSWEWYRSDELGKSQERQLR